MGMLFGIIPILAGIFVIVIAILTLLAINNLHRIPKIQESIENIEKYTKYIAQYIQKQNLNIKSEIIENNEIQNENINT